jgi:hypothetical protein
MEVPENLIMGSKADAELVNNRYIADEYNIGGHQPAERQPTVADDLVKPWKRGQVLRAQGQLDQLRRASPAGWCRTRP